MTHSADCTLASSGRLSYDCEECLEKKVGDLDDTNFQKLMGVSRGRFEAMCQKMYTLDRSVYTSLGSGSEGDVVMPTKLYNFWTVIMEASAVKVQLRKDELERRIRAKGHV